MEGSIGEPMFKFVSWFCLSTFIIQKLKKSKLLTFQIYSKDFIFQSVCSIQSVYDQWPPAALRRPPRQGVNFTTLSMQLFQMQFTLWSNIIGRKVDSKMSVKLSQEHFHWKCNRVLSSRLIAQRRRHQVEGGDLGHDREKSSGNQEWSGVGSAQGWSRRERMDGTNLGWRCHLHEFKTF